MANTYILMGFEQHDRDILSREQKSENGSSRSGANDAAARRATLGNPLSLLGSSISFAY